jgi:hypothetical protein
MPFILIESLLPASIQNRAVLEEALRKVSDQAFIEGASLLEVQVSSDFTRAFLVLDIESMEKATQIVASHGFPITLVKHVRRIDQDKKAEQPSQYQVQYLLEWSKKSELMLLPPGSQHSSRSETGCLALFI